MATSHEGRHQHDDDERQRRHDAEQQLLETAATSAAAAADESAAAGSVERDDRVVYNARRVGVAGRVVVVVVFELRPSVLLSSRHLPQVTRHVQPLHVMPLASHTLHFFNCSPSVVIPQDRDF